MTNNSDSLNIFDKLASNDLSNAEIEKLMDAMDEYSGDAPELSDFNRIDKCIEQDFEAFNPPTEMKNNVFKGLGLSIPTNTIVNVATKAPFAFWKKVAAPIAAALFMGLLSYNYFANTDNTLPQANQLNHSNAAGKSYSANKQITIAKGTDSKVSYPVSSNKSNNYKAISIKHNSKKYSNFDSDNSASNVNNSNNIIDNSSNNPNTDVAVNISPAIERINPINYSRTNQGNAANPSPVEIGGRHGLTQEFTLFREEFTLRNGFLTLRGLAGTTFASNFDFNNSLLNSVAIGYYTNMLSSENLSLGIEGGYEPFEKKYFDKWEPGKLVSVDNPNIFWGALAIRYSTNSSIFSGIDAVPFSTFMLGASEIGPMGRLLVGLDYSISKAMNLYTAIDGSMAFYQNKVEWLTSKKLSFTFGASYHF